MKRAALFGFMIGALLSFVAAAPRERVGRGRLGREHITGSPACVPTSCVALGFTCSTADDGCGDTLDCGSCSETSSCVSNVCVAQPYALTVATAAEQDVMTECACQSSVTGSYGISVSEIRDGGAFCTSGDWNTGIPTGAMVWCLSDQLRVMSGDGTTKGFMSEPVGLNYVPSQDMTDVSWTLGSTGGAALPTVSPPDAGLCPDNTWRATRVQVPATNSSQYSFVIALSGLPASAGVVAAGSYIRGYSSDGGVDQRVSSNMERKGYHYALWTRAKQEYVSENEAYYGFGNFGLQLGSSRAAADFLVCFHQSEASPTLSSYTPDLRGEDRISAQIMVPQGSDLRLYAEILTEGEPALPSGNKPIGPIGISRPSPYKYFGFDSQDLDGGLAVRNQWTTSIETIPDGGRIRTLTSNGITQLWCAWNGDGEVSACIDSTCVDGGVVNVPLYDIDNNTEQLDIGFRSFDDPYYRGQPGGIIRDIRITSAATKEVYLYGDSIVANYGIAQDVIHKRLGNAVAIQNKAVAGERVEQCRSRWNDTVTALRAHPALAPRAYMMVQCGTNNSEVKDGGYLGDAGFVALTLEQMLLAGQDAGAHMLWSTLTPRCDNCSFVSYVNARLTAFCAANGINVADTNTPLSSDGGVCGEWAAQYDSDCVHPQDAGYVAETVIWMDAGGW